MAHPRTIRPRRRIAVVAGLALALSLHAATVGAQGASAFDAKMKDAETLLARRQFEDALRIFKDANALQGKKSAAALIGMARAHSGLGEQKKAIDAATDALKYTADDRVLEASARSVRGRAHFALGDKPNDKRWKQAEEDFRAAVALAPDSAVGKYNLGLSLLKQARDEEGVRELQAYLEQSPTGPDAVNARRYVANPRYVRENFAPAYEFTTLDGSRVSSEDLLGKVVLLDFWATWCGPCREATPGLAKIHKKLDSPAFAIVGISADRDQVPWRAFIEKHRLAWAQFFDDKKTVASRFGVNGYPTYILIDHEGIIRYRKLGWNPSVDGEIEREAKKLLKAAKEAADRRP